MICRDCKHFNIRKLSCDIKPTILKKDYSKFVCYDFVAKMLCVGCERFTNECTDKMAIKKAEDTGKCKNYKMVEGYEYLNAPQCIEWSKIEELKIDKQKDEDNIDGSYLDKKLLTFLIKNNLLRVVIKGIDEYFDITDYVKVKLK